MGKEIEVKYKLRESGIITATCHLEELFEIDPQLNLLKERVLDEGKVIQQGYLSLRLGIIIGRELGAEMGAPWDTARLRQKGDKYYFTLKGPGLIEREEFEPGEDGQIEKALFDRYWGETLGRRVSKNRLKLPYQNFHAETDVFTDRDLILSEVEVKRTPEIELLNPLGEDVTEDPNYQNVKLAK